MVWLSTRWLAFRSPRGKLNIVCVSFVHDCDFGELELVSLLFGSVEEVKSKILKTQSKRKETNLWTTPLVVTLAQSFS